MITTPRQQDRRRFAAKRFGLVLVWIGLTVVMTGCGEEKQKPERIWQTTFPPRMTVAVAPALNFSGSQDFDPVQVADLMASELSGFPGVGVIGVNRVLAILADQRVDQVQSPEHALALCERLGADQMLVFAVTEYDPYTPVVGFAAQVYARREQGPMLDPVATSRMARPFAVTETQDNRRPVAQVQRTFNAAHEMVQQQVEYYAEARQSDQSPYGWKKYLASVRHYLRFCCHAVAEDLIAQQDPGLTVADLTVP